MRLPVPVTVIAALFGAAMVYLIVVALVPKRVAVFEATAPRAVAAGGADTVTIDARDGETWRFFSFSRGWLTAPDTASWDVGVRRFHLIASGEVLRRDAPFDQLTVAPDTAGYVPTAWSRDTVNPALARWYRYSMFSHLLLPKPVIFVFRTRDGGATKLELLSYYCPGPEPGCLTFRFVRLR
jgi:hypothetical protein